MAVSEGLRRYIKKLLELNHKQPFCSHWLSDRSPCLIHLTLFLEVVALSAYEKKRIIRILTFYGDIIKWFQCSLVINANFSLSSLQRCGVFKVCRILHCKKAKYGLIVLVKRYYPRSIYEPDARARLHKLLSFVWPDIEDVLALCLPETAFITDDLPVFG